jgi:NAD(P)-dependent dehydrogenase (short-subunit alcohol dehydrogenase family)
MSTSSEQIPLSELISLKGKRAIITGGATGIGFAISSRFAEAGATVFIADIVTETANNASDSLKKGGYTAYSWSIMPGFIPGNRLSK